MLVTALLFLAFLFFDPSGNVLRAREAMKLWAEAVAPSVFPFLAVLPFLTSCSAEKAYRALPLMPLRRLFRLSDGAVPTAVAGLLAGSPSGAIAIGNAFDSGRISRREAYTLFSLTGGASPVFLVCSAGAGMFKSAALGVGLLISSLLSAGITAFMAAHMLSEGERRPLNEAISDTERDGLWGAVKSTLTVCAWMVLFRVYAGVLPDRIACFAEISWGCAYAARIDQPLLAAAICSFSGACIGMQNFSVLAKRGMNAFLMFFIKCVQMLLGICIFQAVGALDFSMPSVRADAFTAAAVLALTLCGAIFLRKMIGKRKRKHGIQKTGY